MITNRFSPNIFTQAALQNNVVAKNLSEIAARSRVINKKASFNKYEKIFDASSLMSADHAMLSREYFGFPAQMSYKRTFFPRIIGIIILIAGLLVIGFIVGPTLYRLLIDNWNTILLIIGGIFIGSGLILLVGKVNKNPLKNIQPPDSTTEEPLVELERLADRTISRLRTAYHLQIILICVVAILLFFIVIWSIVMVVQNQLVYATFFGSSGIAMVVLSKWKWQPFDRVSEARKLADDADILTTGLRLRIKTISEITDPKERAQAQWVAVSEYLEKS